MNNSKMKIILLAAVPFVLILTWAIISNVNLAKAKSDLQQAQNNLSQTQTELSANKVELADTQKQLADTQDNLAQTKLDLSLTQTQLDATKTDLNNAQIVITDTKSQLTSTQNQLTATQAQLSTANSDLSTAKSQLGDSQSQLASAMQQVSDMKKTLQGLGVTVHSATTAWTFNGMNWVHNDNAQAANPTFAGLLSFIAADKTDLNKYDAKAFNCVNYSTTVYNNAESQGIEAAEVTINLKNSAVGHAINAFITSDYGLVWVDCTGNDAISRVEAGKVYRGVPASNISPAQLNNDGWWDTLHQYYYLQLANGSEAVVDSIDIYW